MKVIGSRSRPWEEKVGNPYSRNVKLPVAITLVLHNRAMGFACSMGLSAMVDRMV